MMMMMIHTENGHCLQFQMRIINIMFNVLNPTVIKSFPWHTHESGSTFPFSIGRLCCPIQGWRVPLIGHPPPWRRPLALDQKPTISWSGSCIWNQGRIGISFSSAQHTLLWPRMMADVGQDGRDCLFANFVGCPRLFRSLEVGGVLRFL